MRRRGPGSSAVDRVVETAPEIRQEGDVMIIPIVEEEVVLVTRLVLREEIHVRKKTTQRTEQFTVKLRAERAEITDKNPPQLVRSGPRSTCRAAAAT